MTFSNKEIAQIAVNNGFPGNNRQALITCVCIARAESGGNPDAINRANSNGTIDRGLWQINSVHDAKMAGADRFDPNVNAKLMIEISSGGTNWQPWSTYNNGMYKQFLTEVTNDLGGGAINPNSQAFLGSGLASGATNALDATGDFFEWLVEPRTWARVGLVLLGSALIFMGIIAMLKESNTIKQATSAALTVATKGKL